MKNCHVVIMIKTLFANQNYANKSVQNEKKSGRNRSGDSHWIGQTQSNNRMGGNQIIGEARFTTDYFQLVHVVLCSKFLGDGPTFSYLKTRSNMYL